MCRADHIKDIDGLLAAALSSRCHVHYGSKAHISGTPGDVRFVPKPDSCAAAFRAAYSVTLSPREAAVHRWTITLSFSSFSMSSWRLNA
jgi:hypothetical protein